MWQPGDLDPEESENFNFGVAWQSDAFTATLDYWDIKQEEKIDELPFGLVYQATCNDQNSPPDLRARRAAAW